MSRFLYRIARFAEDHHRPILVVALALMALAAGLLLRVRFDPDVLSLLPADDEAVQVFRETLDEFGALDLLLVVVRVPEDAVVDPYQQLVDDLASRLEAIPELEYVEYRIGDPDDLLRTFFPRALLYLDEAQRAEVLERLESGGLETRAAELKRQVLSPQSVVTKKLHQLDPLGLAEVFLGQVRGRRGSLGVDWSSGYYLSGDRRLFLLLAKPTGASQDIVFTRNLVRTIEPIFEELQAEWNQRWAEEIASGRMEASPSLALGGGYLTSLDDADLIQRDVIVNAFTSMGVVLLLFYFAFRRLGLLIYAFLPLSCGLLLTFGAAGATGKVLSSATSACAALLVGLGIDFVIVSYGRYVEERNQGASPSDALHAMTGSCGRAVVVGGVTSAATFYAFTITEFTGLRQMGFMTATGILLCMVAVLLLLPALLAWSEKRHAARDSRPTLFVHGFGAGKLVRWSAEHPTAALSVGLVITVASSILLPRLELVSAIQNMRPDGNRGIQVQTEVAEHFGSNFKYMMLVLSGENRDEVLDLAARAADAAQPMLASGDLYRVDSIASLIPPPSNQQDVLRWLAANEEILDPDRLRRDFTEALRAQGLNPAAFEEGLGLLGQALSAREPVSPDDFEEMDSTRRLLQRYLRQGDDGTWRSVVYLYAPESKWRREPPPEAEVLAAKLGPQAKLTGVNVVSRSLRQQVWKDAVGAAVLGSLLVAFLLWLDFRRLSDTFLTLVPLTLGIVWMFGVMVVLGLDLNFMNIFVTTMIIGIGVDYGVHMLHRRRELEDADDETLIEGLSETGRAIAMAAVTTSVGFGSLALSHYPGLRTIGYLAILGAAATALVAITMLPAYLMLVRRSRRV